MAHFCPLAVQHWPHSMLSFKVTNRNDCPLDTLTTRKFKPDRTCARAYQHEQRARAIQHRYKTCTPQTVTPTTKFSNPSVYNRKSLKSASKAETHKIKINFPLLPKLTTSTLLSEANISPHTHTVHLSTTYLRY
jgi:hypothetical protein